MSNFYVDSITGSDANDGSTPSTAWRRINRVQTLIANKGLGPGDQVLFRRGGEYFGRMAPVGVEGGAPIVLRGYGEGARPKISGYKIANVAAGWALHSPGIWKIDISQTSTAITGDIVGTNGNTDVGFLKVDGKIRPVKVRTVAALAGMPAWSFTSDATFLYVVAEANPTTLAADIRVATRGNALTPGSGVRLLGLEIEGTGGHGVRPLAGVSHDGAVIGCSIHDFGGGYLNQDPALLDDTRFGNGVEIWIGARSWLVRGNEISDCYDTAFTLQGSATAGGINGWADIVFEYNRVWNSSQSVEFWCQAQGFTGPGFVRVKVRHNELVNSGYSWGEAVPTNSGKRGVAFLSYAMELGVDIESHNNIVVGSKDSYAFHRRIVGGVEANSWPVGWNSHDNTVALAPLTRMRYAPQAGDKAYAVEAAADWVAAEKVEAGTLFEILPASVSGDIDNWTEAALTLLATKASSAERRSEVTLSYLGDLEARALAGSLAAASTTPRGERPAPAAGLTYVFSDAYVTTKTIPASDGTNALRLAPFRPASSGHVEALGIEVVTAGSAGATARLAVYRVDGASLVLVAQVVVPAETAGLAEGAVDFFVRAGEDLWVGAVRPSGPTTIAAVRGATGPSQPRTPVPAASALFGFANRVSGLQISGVSGPAPASATLGATGLTTDLPVVGLKMSAY